MLLYVLYVQCHGEKGLILLLVLAPNYRDGMGHSCALNTESNFFIIYPIFLILGMNSNVH